ncbi:MAG: NAD(P)H-dependent oxidoreductase [Verrucomicrobiales bacterium]|jgi:NAD(P)H-dependent FMN reductase|nr:NAD(P)H-dependent oxidoreductase [Verrucomicrobiales bacterium]
MIEIIIGTNRPGSNSKKVAAQILEIFKQQGTSAQILDLAELPPDIFSPLAYAEKPAVFATLSGRVLDASGLLIVSPEYNGGIPGVLKYFIDMLKFPESFESKPVAFVGVSAGIWGALRPVEHLQQIFGYRNAFIYPARVFIPGVFQEIGTDGRLKSADLVQRLTEQAKGFTDFAARLNSGHKDAKTQSLV